MGEWGDEVDGSVAPDGNGRVLLRQVPTFRRLWYLLIVAVQGQLVGCDVSIHTHRGKARRKGNGRKEVLFLHGFHNLNARTKLDDCHLLLVPYCSL